MTFIRRTAALMTVLALSMIAATVMPADASHSWANYHWARTSNPFTLQLGDNVSGTWDSYLSIASTDWSKSSVLDTGVVPGGADPRKCRPTSGRVEVCNAAYGRNGWLGIAQIWASGDHIVQGVTKMNDSYFNLATYNTPAWRQFVMCQEIGHTFGLAHQDENFTNPNLGSCMDYTNDPSTNQHPNQHDYDQLVTIYTHLDSTTTVGPAAAGSGRAGPAAAPGIREDGTPVGASPARGDVYVTDLGGGRRIVTFITWAR